MVNTLFVRALLVIVKHISLLQIDSALKCRPPRPFVCECAVCYDHIWICCPQHRIVATKVAKILLPVNDFRVKHRCK